MHLFVLPVSGGAYVSQLAILQHLCEAKMLPDIIFASSGGNVASYIALASEWKWAGIERILEELNCTLFAKPWHNIPPVAFLMGVMKGNIYDSGSGVTEFFQRHFDKSLVTSVEIWTGTNNIEEQKAAIFCNRSSSQLNTSYFDNDLYNAAPLCYLHGDVKSIGKVSVASASIPSIVPPQEFDGFHYADGGISGASPLTTIHDVVDDSVDDGEELHITYINSCNLMKCEKSVDGNVFQTWKQAMADLVRAQTAIDRAAAHALIKKRKTGPLQELFFPCTFENLTRVKELRLTNPYTLLELYPQKNYEVDITSFTGAEAVEVLRSAYQDCRMHLWY